MSAPTGTTFVPGVYYQHHCAPNTLTLFKIQDVVNYPVAVPLFHDQFVFCEAIVHRSGGNGRGLYAKLRHRRSGHDVVLYHRVSRNHIGSGNWSEANAMMVLALQEDLPVA